MLKYHVRRPAIHHQHAEAAKLARLALLVNLGDAAFWTVIPIQLAEILGGDGPVGFYLSVLAIAVVAAMLGSGGLFERHSRLKIAIGSMVLMGVLLIGMSVARSLWLFALFDFPRSIAFMVVTVALGLLVRDHSTLEDLPVEEGRYYLFSNLGWLIGPLLAGYTARFAGTEAVFAVVAAIFLGAVAYMWRIHLSGRPVLTATNVDLAGTKPWRAVREFLRHARLRDIFALSLALEFWWVITAVYIPLAVIELGFGADIVGWVIAGGIVPLVLFEMWVGKLAARNGVRRYLVLGFGILGVGAVSFAVFGFLPEVLLFLFAAVNLGAAFVEPLVDTYFFEVTTEEEGDRYFGMFNSADPMAALLAPLAGAAVLTVGLGLNAVWLLTAAVMTAALALALRLPDVELDR